MPPFRYLKWFFFKDNSTKCKNMWAIHLGQRSSSFGVYSGKKKATYITRSRVLYISKIFSVSLFFFKHQLTQLVSLFSHIFLLFLKMTKLPFLFEGGVNVSSKKADSLLSTHASPGCPLHI